MSQSGTMYIGASVLIEKDGKLLMGKRLNVTGEGDWGFIGGHVDSGENIEQAAIREVFEETGLKLNNLEFLGIINQSHQPSSMPPTRHYIQTVFYCKDFTGEVENKEPQYCSELKWFEKNNLPEEMFFAHKNFSKLLDQKQNYLED